MADFIKGIIQELNQLKEEKGKLERTLAEIKKIAQVNPINTCWSAMNLCIGCYSKKECGLQSPFEKLKSIIQIIDEVE